MSKATSETERKRSATPKAPREAQNDETAGSLKPRDSEVSFEHLLRNMVIERDEARKKRD